MKLLRDVNVHLENKRVSRIFFLFLWFLYALVCMTKNGFSGALSAIRAEGTFTITQTTFISAAFYIVYTPLQFLGGILADKMSPTRLILIGLVGSALPNVVIFFNQNYYVMLFSWVFSAAVQFALWPALFKLYSSQLVRSDRGMMVLFMSFAGSGGLAFSYLFAAIVPHWRYNFAISAIVLLLLAVGLLLFTRKIDPLLLPDEVPTSKVDDKEPPKGWRMILLFLSSGFVLCLASAFLRYAVENSTKTLSATMLADSYASVPPGLGNLLTILIVILGLVGTLLVRFLLYPRLFKNEFTCTLVLLLLSLPFVILLRFVGTISLPLCLMALCMLSFLVTGTSYLASCFAARFVAYRLNGTAAGVLNAAYSLALVFQYTLFGNIADKIGWNSVTTLWILLIALATVLIALAIRPSIRFKREIHN